MDNGWIAIHRRIIKKGWFKEPDYLALWILLLLKASFTENEWLYKGEIQKVNRGQFVTSRKNLALESGIQESKIERILKCFESEQQIEQQMNSKNRLITINNYNLYQKNEQQNEQQMNTKRTASEHEVNTINKDNNEKKVNNNTPLPPKGDTDTPIKKVVETYESVFTTKLLSLSEQRKKKVSARLRSFTVEQVSTALINFAGSAWHRGENDRGWRADFDWIMKNDETIEKGLRLMPDKPPPDNRTMTEKFLSKLNPPKNENNGINRQEVVRGLDTGGVEH